MINSGGKMNIKEFKKTIQFDELVKTDDSDKFMYKSYLDCLLAGGKIRERAFLYAVGKTMGENPERPLLNAFAGEEDFGLRFVGDKMVKDLSELFKQMKKDKFWITEETLTQEFDENGKEIDWFSHRKEPKAISKRIETTKKIIYYLNKPLDIKPLKLK